MSKEDMAQLSLLLLIAAAVLIVVAWQSYRAAKSKQEKLNGIFGKYGTQERKLWHLFLYVACPLASAGIAYGGYLAAVPIVMYLGLYGLLGIGAHRVAYELGKKAGTDPDPHYE